MPRLDELELLLELLRQELDEDELLEEDELLRLELDEELLEEELLRLEELLEEDEADPTTASVCAPVPVIVALPSPELPIVNVADAPSIVNAHAFVGSRSAI